jgi:hypothetical protein
MSTRVRKRALEEVEAWASTRSDEELRAWAAGMRRQRWLVDPVAWISERPKEVAWSAQREIICSVRDHRYTAVQACHDSGKSWIASRIAAWWIDTHPTGEAIVVTSAPTFDQVKRILWRELQVAHKAGKLPGTLNQTDWYIDGTLVAFGRKPADYQEAAFQGIHAPYVLVILDEASGIPEQLWRAAETLVTNEGSRLLAIGNPDDPTGHFARVCGPNSGWHVIGISGLDTPNFTEEKVPRSLADQLLSPTWVDERRERWGEGSPLWVSKVLGRFPDRSDDQLIPLSWIERARERAREPGGVVSLGVDVARFGSDETVIVRCQGGKVRVLLAKQGLDTMQTCGYVIQAIHEHGPSEVRIDEVGVGGGVIDRLREQGYAVKGMTASARAEEPHRFANLRAEVYWYMREAFEQGWIDLDPADEILAEQLASIRYKVNSRGQIQIESKDEMRARGMHSPDHADAFAVCLAWDPEVVQYLMYEPDDYAPWRRSNWSIY